MCVFGVVVVGPALFRNDSKGSRVKLNKTKKIPLCFCLVWAHFYFTVTEIPISQYATTEERVGVPILV